MAQLAARPPKTFELVWGVPSNGLVLPSVSTARCGDTIRLRCAPGTTHGVFRMNSLDGQCPESFNTPAAGSVLAAPSPGCDFSLTLGDEPDFFLTSQTGADCDSNLKMYVHSVCPSATMASASGVVSAGSVQGSSMVAISSLQAKQRAAAAAGAATAGTGAVPGMTLGAGQLENDDDVMESAKSSAAPYTRTALAMLAPAVAAAVAALAF